MHDTEDEPYYYNVKILILQHTSHSLATHYDNRPLIGRPPLVRKSGKQAMLYQGKLKCWTLFSAASGSFKPAILIAGS